MKTITPTELCNNMDQILDKIWDTGILVKINKGGKKRLIKSIEQPNKLQNLKKRKNIIKGDSNDLINLTWEKEINLD